MMPGNFLPLGVGLRRLGRGVHARDREQGLLHVRGRREAVDTPGLDGLQEESGQILAEAEVTAQKPGVVRGHLRRDSRRETGDVASPARKGRRPARTGPCPAASRAGPVRAQYRGVPPWPVAWTSWLAMLKSMSFGRCDGSSSRMFAGLMSRWRMPWPTDCWRRLVLLVLLVCDTPTVEFLP